MALNKNVLISIAGIWGILILASLLVWLLTKVKPQRNYQELIQRTQSWWVMLSIFTAALIFNTTISFIFLAFISYIALKEYFSIIPTRRTDRRVIFWAYLSVPLQFYWAGIGWFGMFIIFIPVYMFLFIPFRLLLTNQTEGFLKSTGIIQWGLMITVFSLSHMAYLLSLPTTSNNSAGGAGLLLYLVFLTQFNDVAQYTWGKLLGKHKIIPAISPKKTWEGLLGGVITTTLLAILIAPVLTPFSILMAMITGIIISCIGFIGDITISAIKRDLTIKDTGSIIPGHGGILDRVDSLTFTAPIFFHLIYYMYF